MKYKPLLLLSSLFDNWLKIITTVANTSGFTKLTFEGIKDLNS